MSERGVEDDERDTAADRTGRTDIFAKIRIAHAKAVACDDGQ